MVPMSAGDCRRIGVEILTGLDIDENRLGEALSALNDRVTRCLQGQQWDRASECCRSACEFLESMDTVPKSLMSPVKADYAQGIFRAYVGVGCLYRASEQSGHNRTALLEEAKELFEEGWRAFDTERDRWNEGVMCLNLGRLYKGLDDQGGALFQLQRALHAFSQLSVETSQGMIDETMAELEEIRNFVDPSGAPLASAQYELHFLPIVGEGIAAGKPIPTQDEITGYVSTGEVSIEGEPHRIEVLGAGRSRELRFLFAHRYFVSPVKGNSMDQANINDGDYVIIRRPLGSLPSPDNGDIVAAVILGVDREATLKRYRERGAQIVLLPESSDPTHSPYTFTREDAAVEIAGVAVAVLRKV